jgi:hypothetical protein
VGKSEKADVSLLVAQRGVKAHDGVFFLPGEHAVLEPRPEVVDPSQPAALAVPLQSCTGGHFTGNLDPSTPQAKVHLTQKNTMNSNKKTKLQSFDNCWLTKKSLSFPSDKTRYIPETRAQSGEIGKLSFLLREPEGSPQCK